MSDHHHHHHHHQRREITIIVTTFVYACAWRVLAAAAADAVTSVSLTIFMIIESHTSVWYARLCVNMITGASEIQATIPTRPPVCLNFLVRGDKRSRLADSLHCSSQCSCGVVWHSIMISSGSASAAAAAVPRPNQIKGGEACEIASLNSGQP